MRILYNNNCWFTNVGEAFIDIGAMRLLENVFPGVPVGCCSNMSEVYVNRYGEEYKTLHEKEIRVIKSEDYFGADYIILSGMYASEEFLNCPTRTKVEAFVKNGAKLIFLGLGQKTYSQKEADAFKRWLTEIKPELAVTRDEKTYENLCDAAPCIQGMDCAFWIEEAFRPKGCARKEYEVVAFNRGRRPEEIEKEIYTEKYGGGV